MPEDSLGKRKMPDRDPLLGPSLVNRRLGHETAQGHVPYDPAYPAVLSGLFVMLLVR